MNMAADTLFREVLGNLELEAQAKYNQKITKEQNMCRSANEGGIMGRKDMASTYMWAKLRGRRVPKNYATNGLKTTEFVESNDLYGSFCRARITVQSDDPEIQRYIQDRKTSKDWTTAYFAVGDVFTCGSWIPQSDLEAIARYVACNKAKANGTLKRDADCYDSKVIEQIDKTTGQKWATVAATFGSIGLGGVGGAYLANYLQDSNMLGGLTKPNKNTSSQRNRNISAATSCTGYVYPKLSNTITDDEKTKAYMAAQGMLSASKDISSKNNNSALRSARTSVEENCTDEDAAVLPACKAAFASLKAACQNVIDFDGQYDEDDGAIGRAVTNVVGASIGATTLGLLGGLATGKNIKAANRKQFTADEQAFMNNVGNHIYCFVGADEAGTYGDLIQLSLD